MKAMDISENLKNVNILLTDLREKANLSKDDFANLMTVSKSSINRIEDFSKEPFLRSVIRLGYLSGWSMDYIINQKKKNSHDGNINFFLNTIKEYVKTKNVDATYEYAINNTKTLNDSVISETAITELSKRIIETVLEIQLNQSQLVSDNKKLNTELNVLTTNLSNQKKIIDSSDQIIKLLKDQNPK